MQQEESMEPSLPWHVMSRKNPAFCKVFGTDAADPEADADVKGIADVAAWMVEGSLYWKALTEKGEALTEAVKNFLPWLMAIRQKWMLKKKQSITL